MGNASQRWWHSAVEDTEAQGEETKRPGTCTGEVAELRSCGSFWPPSCSCVPARESEGSREAWGSWSRRGWSWASQLGTLRLHVLRRAEPAALGEVRRPWAGTGQAPGGHFGWVPCPGAVRASLLVTSGPGAGPGAWRSPVPSSVTLVLASTFSLGGRAWTCCDPRALGCGEWGPGPSSQLSKPRWYQGCWRNSLQGHLQQGFTRAGKDLPWGSGVRCSRCRRANKLHGARFT